MRFQPATLVIAAALLAPPLAVAQGGKPKSTCGSDVSLSVTIAGTPLAAGGFGLISDGLGAYSDGTKGSAKVSAHFQVENCTHDFTLNLASSTRSMWALLSGNVDVRAWFFNLDRVHSVPVTAGNQAQLNAYCSGGVEFGNDGKIVKNPAGWYHDNYGGCGVDENGAFVRRGGGFSLDGDERLAFHNSPIDRPAVCGTGSQELVCSASYFRVYHPDANTWIVRPEAPAESVHQVWAGGNAGYQAVGIEPVPFEIIAVRK